MSKEKVVAPASNFQDDVIAAHMRGVSGYTPSGLEIPSSKPVEVPIEFTRPVPLADEIRRLLRESEFQDMVARAGAETFDEADDFDTGEDGPEMASPYEDCFEPTAPGVVAREQEIRSGFVEDRPQEVKDGAREAVRKLYSERSGSGGEGRPGAVAAGKGSGREAGKPDSGSQAGAGSEDPIDSTHT